MSIASSSAGDAVLWLPGANLLSPCLLLEGAAFGVTSIGLSQGESVGVALPACNILEFGSIKSLLKLVESP